MEDIEFTVHVDPPSKSRARFTQRHGKMVAYTPEATKTGEALVASAFRQAARNHSPLLRKFYGIEVTFYCGTRQRRDIDNMCKLLLDGLNEVAYPDDSCVTELTARKFYVSKAEARMEVRFYEVGDDMINVVQCAAEGCDNDFRVYLSTRSGGQRYCSAQCREATVAVRRNVICLECGETFTTSHHTRGDKKFCSRECKSAHGRAEVKCSACGVSFSKPQSWVRENNYCSEDCRRTGAAQRAKDRRTTQFRGRCEVCGVGTTRKEYKRCRAHQERSPQKPGTKRGPYKKAVQE